MQKPFFHEEKWNISVPFLTSRQATPIDQKRTASVIASLTFCPGSAVRRKPAPWAAVARAVLHKCGTTLVILILWMTEGLLELFEWCHSAAVPLAIWLSYCKCAKNLGPSLNFYLCWGQPCGLPHYTEPAGATLLGRQPALSSQQEQFQLNLQSEREGSGLSIKTNSARISAKWWSVTVCPSSWENKTLFRDCIPLLSKWKHPLLFSYLKKTNKIQTIRRLII